MTQILKYFFVMFNFVGQGWKLSKRNLIQNLEDICVRPWHVFSIFFSNKVLSRTDLNPVCGLLTFIFFLRHFFYFLILLVPHDPFISCLVLLIYVLFSFTFLLPLHPLPLFPLEFSSTNNFFLFSDPLKRFLLDPKIVMGNLTVLSTWGRFIAGLRFRVAFGSV